MSLPSEDREAPLEHQQGATPTCADAVCGELTVTYDIRYVDGAEGDRVAAAQAKAISALLSWLATRDDTAGDHVDPPEGRSS
ncbi:hypothetical protein Aglo03_25130 [Actinokineospora globicatena]|uniref:Uncharacterized protein n=1 Tax=Actinokineospora globicatena TaxID=103729 RepID=A0A9W6V7U7_9PSEU|nr:hypothetical protein Aglo03_25130 [Actinokineospora globicatena]